MKYLDNDTWTGAILQTVITVTVGVSIVYLVVS